MVMSSEAESGDSIRHPRGHVTRPRGWEEKRPVSGWGVEEESDRASQRTVAVIALCWPGPDGNVVGSADAVGDDMSVACDLHQAGEKAATPKTAADRAKPVCPRDSPRRWTSAGKRTNAAWTRSAFRVRV